MIGNRSMTAQGAIAMIALGVFSGELLKISFPDYFKVSNNMASAIYAGARDIKTYAFPSAWQNQSQHRKISCPSDMKLVNSDVGFCSEFEHVCKKWIDPPGSIVRRCAEYDSTKTKCKNNRRCTHAAYCIDELEASEPGSLPTNDVSWLESRNACMNKGKRLCTVHEWTHACEGPNGNPYPQGHSRSSGKCNIDNVDLSSRSGELKVMLRKSGSEPLCSSYYGVKDMIGNIDEWTHESIPAPHYSVLKGGWWGPLRNRCQPATTAHDEEYHDVQTGYRCCADAILE